MKIRIELDPQLSATEIVLRTNQLTPEITQLEKWLRQIQQDPLVFYKGNSEYFLSLEELLFFETDGAKIFGHTKYKAYEVKLKLYELESYLPPYFSRIAKSTIVNVRKIYSLERSFSGTR